MTTKTQTPTAPEHGETVFIPLNKLKKHPKNARKTPHSEASIEGKAASIAAKGMPLDPNQHQAMMEIPTDEVEAGTIVQEMQAGYMIKDRLLRPAMVGVAKKPD